MKYLPLSQRKFAIIDDEDFEELNQWKWSYRPDGYAVRRESNNNIIRMHRFIIKTPKGLLTDHINGNRLDNRRCNLRICNDLQNGWNKHTKPKGASGIIGVLWYENLKKWRAKICVKGKHIHIGLFVNQLDAIKARELAELKYFGEYAPLSPTSGNSALAGMAK